MIPQILEGKKFLLEVTKFRMKVVDEHESIREIEDTLKCGIIEILIIHAHDMLRLIRLLKDWQPWNLPIEHNDPQSDTDLDLGEALYKSKRDPNPSSPKS